MVLRSRTTCRCSVRHCQCPRYTWEDYPRLTHWGRYFKHLEQSDNIDDEPEYDKFVSSYMQGKYADARDLRKQRGEDPDDASSA